MSIQPIMKNKLQGWLAPNTLTEDPDDRILILKSAGTVNDERIYEEMRNEDTDLRKETMVHVVTLYERIVARFLMNGNNVNTGLFYAVPRFTGIIQEGRWNPLINDIYVDFTQNRVLREEIRNTQVEILGEKPSSVYFASAQDCSTGQTDATSARDATSASPARISVWMATMRTWVSPCAIYPTTLSRGWNPTCSEPTTLRK